MTRSMSPGGHTNFMVLTRATNEHLPGADGILGTADDLHADINQTTPFVDQSQTYASDPSHQVFLREYMIGADGQLHSTGKLLQHAQARRRAGHGRRRHRHGDLGRPEGQRAQASASSSPTADVGDVPLLATDAYGNFIPGAHGFAQLVVQTRRRHAPAWWKARPPVST